MDATTLNPDAALPTDVTALQDLVRRLLVENARLRAENAEMRGELARLRQDNAELQGKVDAALRQRFGRRSERRTRPAKGQDRPGKRRDEHGRAPLPEHLERRERLQGLTEAEKLCPC